MEDSDILDLYFCRSERAITETSDKYGSGLLRLSRNITGNPRDAEECVSDTYLQAWNRIPPLRPARFFSWLAKVARSFSYRKWERQNTLKRSARLISITDELEECVPSGSDVSAELEAKLLSEAINRFVSELDRDMQTVFMRRYFWSESIKDISAETGFSEAKLKSMLFRMRKKLRERLEKEDFDL